jgi:hypothetical protein
MKGLADGRGPAGQRRPGAAEVRPPARAPRVAWRRCHRPGGPAGPVKRVAAVAAAARAAASGPPSACASVLAIRA